MHFGALEAIYFDSLAELLKWHSDKLQEIDTGDSRLDRFRQPVETIDSYEIEDLNRSNGVGTMPESIDGSDLPSACFSLSSSPSFHRPRVKSATSYQDDRSLRRFHSARSFHSDHSLRPTHTDTLNHHPKLMICHDFKNGYREGIDKSTVGYYPHPTGDRYFMEYPQLVDSFVYFSHHRVTIPPASSINTCHRNCIKCFGTLIFEGPRFLSDLDRLVTKGHDGTFPFAEMLTELVVQYGFDGFLINLEAQFSNSILADRFIPFIDSLKAQLHALSPKNEVIIYDSYCLKTNRVSYSNGVNQSNFDLFCTSDKFFTNYWWNISHLRMNLKYAGLLGVQQKLYTGYDVWGRGKTMGKGGFDTGQACKMIAKYQSNIALFAPGWTYEQLGARNFSRNDARLWIGLFEDEMSVMSAVKPHNVPVFKINSSSFLFYTNFSTGQGRRFYCKGVCIYGQSWVDGNLQTYLPLELYRTSELGLQMKLDSSQSFHGGSCLSVRYVPYIEETHGTVKGCKIFSEQQVRRLSLFGVNRTCQMGTIGVRVSYKLAKATEMMFKLEISFHVCRGNSKDAPTLRTGCLVIPLCSTRNRWITLSNAFTVDTDMLDNVILDDVEICYDNEDMAGQSIDSHPSYIIEDSVVTSVIDNEQFEKINNDRIYDDDENEGWVVVPRFPSAISNSSFGESSSTLPGREDEEKTLKIGEIAIVNANNYPSANLFGIKPVRKVKGMSTHEDGILIVWSDPFMQYVAYYIVYVNDHFGGTTQIPQFFAPHRFIHEFDESIDSEDDGKPLIKVRVDIIDRLGTVFAGSDKYL